VRSGAPAALLALALATACATAQVAVAPPVDAPSSELGRGRAVSLRVVDARLAGRPAAFSVAHWGGASEIEGTPLSAAQSVRAVLETALRRRGFELAPGAGPADATLEVEVVSLRWQRIGFAGRVSAVLRARVTVRGESRVQFHRGARWRSFAPFVDASLVSEALSEALTSLVRDEALLTELAAADDGPR
jgi:uncharacterized lipoprotein YajG